MILLREILAELFGMFVGDARLSAAILAVVALVALMIDVGHVPSLIGGGVLLVGCLVVVVTSTRQGARCAAAADRLAEPCGPEPK